MAKEKDRVVRYAVVGLGHIAQVAVLPAFREARNSRVTALVSGDPAKLKSLSRRYGVQHVYSYEQYDDCLKSGEIDAVYIALPNSMHEEYSSRAADSGIHVLCEKPMAVDVEASERMISAAKEEGVKLMIAYRLHFDPLTLKLIEIANSGRLGELRFFNSEFGYHIKRGNIRTSPHEGGSPLHDLGIYCINAARYLFKAHPIEVYATAANPGANAPKIEQIVAATLKFSEDRIAQFVCSFASAPVGNLRITGTKGDLFVESAYEYAEPRTVHLTVGQRTKTTRSKPGDQFAAELEYFSKCVLEDREPEPSGAHGLIDVQIIEALMESIRTKRPVSLEAKLPGLTRRPDRSLEISRPAHGKPDLVHVERPSKEG